MVPVHEKEKWALTNGVFMHYFIKDGKNLYVLDKT